MKKILQAIIFVMIGTFTLYAQDSETLLNERAREKPSLFIDEDTILTKEQHSNKKMVLLALETSVEGYMSIGSRLRNDELFMKEALAVNGQVLRFLDKKYRANKSWVLLAIKEDSTALEYASNMLISDEDLVEEAVKKWGYSFTYAHQTLKEDRAYILKLLKDKRFIIDYIDDSLKNDTELLDIAVKYDGNALSHFDENLTKDRAFILSVLRNNGSALYYVNENFKKDKELVSVAVQQDAYALVDSDITLRHDKEFLLKLINKNKKVLNKIDIELWKDNAFLLKVLKEYGFGLEYATKAQQDDNALVEKALEYDGYSLEYASERLKKDKIMVLKSLNHYGFPLSFADKSLKEEREFIKKAVEENSYSILYIGKNLQKDRELILLAIQNDEAILGELPKLRKDKAFISLLIKKDLNVFPYIDDSLKNDSELIALSQKIPHKYESEEKLLLELSFLLFILFLYFKFIKKENAKNYLLWGAILVFILEKILSIYFVHGVFRMPYRMVDKTHKFGLEPIRCAFNSNINGSEVECYNMHVPEIYDDNNSRIITFPVRIFRTTDIFSFKSPVLHLGGGGPGADMGLNSAHSLKSHLEEHNEFSVNQGRDLFLIDPRGAGLSKPLLNCGTFVDNILTNIKKGQTLEEEYASVDSDYGECVEKFKKEGVNFNGYNSFSVANDIYRLKEAVGIDKWFLFGVSYSTTYAMIVAKKYPKIVEGMILDSACFPNLKLDHNYFTKTMERYNSLYEYKNKLKDDNLTENNISIDVSGRMWALHKKLNKYPIETGYVGLKVNGDYFIDSLLWGVYGTKIFKDLPSIIKEMEKSKIETFLPYFKNYISYLMDKKFGDVSSMAHYCFEDKSFINFEKIKNENMKLPNGYIQKNAILSFKSKDFCKEMQINSTDKTLADSIKTEIPTLFIHGEFDSVTPLRDVMTEIKGFKNSKLLTYKTSHAVLGTEDKIEQDVALFITEFLNNVVK